MSGSSRSARRPGGRTDRHPADRPLRGQSGHRGRAGSDRSLAGRDTSRWSARDRW